MKELYTITVFAENRPGVLYRIADLFLRRKINIESLTVSEIEKQGLSRFTITVLADHDLVEKVVKQLYRIIEVSKVIEKTNEDLIYKELAFIKVFVKDSRHRDEIVNLVNICQGKAIYVAADFVVVELAATEEEIDRLYRLLVPYGVKEFVRTGRIAVFKKGEAPIKDGY